ncbi:MAG: putative enoyl-CoA hydratase 1 [Alphaproteobacteria bacterium MarineAlpha9_Bin7]|nr:MAG: putative enoyl-CoA hydratase 1 [Alphaproteobacteria bacterium MarineAlpha9_Bin7]
MRIVDSIEELKNLVGEEIGVSDWIEMTQERINKFAEATGDHQWIHVDTERAKTELPGGTTIAHGFLTLSLLPKIVQSIYKVKGVRHSLNYGSDRVRFTAPVPAGSRVRGRYKLKSAEEVKNNGLKIIGETKIEIEGEDRPACIAESIGIIYS